MERNMLKEIKKPVEEPVRLAVYVTGINSLRCTKNGKHYYFVHVTDGEDTASFRLFDSRMEYAKDRFEKRVVYVTLKGKDNLYISKIEECNDIPETEVGDAVNTEPGMEKRILLSDLESFKDSFCCLPVLVTEVGTVKTSKNNKPYYMITVTDGTASASFYIWDDKADEIREKYLNHVVYITVKADEYPKVAQITLCEDYPKTDFIKSAPLPSETMYVEITETLKSMDSTMAPVALKIYEDHKEELLRWAGALKLHHSVYGGLLYHIYRMMKAAESICAVYPDLNKELLLIGVMLHDIGKLKELNTNELGISEFTPEGNLSGHILSGIEMLDRAIWEMDEKPAEEEYRQVKHMIASHHGTLEHGAIVVPATPEAMVLNYLDLIDSRMYMYEETLSGMEPGTVSPSVWALGGIHVYKPYPSPEKKEEEPETEAGTEATE